MSIRIKNCILILMPMCLVLAGCLRRTPAPAPPPATATPSPSNKPETADRRFSAGRFLDAAQAYEAYLKENPEDPDRDRITFRLALSYALAGNETENNRRSVALLRTLYTQFPESQYRPVSQHILSLHSDIDRLRMDLRVQDDRIRDLNESLKEKDQALNEKDLLIQDRDKVLQRKDRMLTEKERTLAQREKALAEMEDKILKLTQELDRMKNIDLQRHPASPPN